jgi:fermentation-respiration switch protein FrsA (DUF1100 family)
MLFKPNRSIQMIRTLMVLLVVSRVVSAQSTDVSGDWTGELNTGSATLHLALHLKNDGSTFESIDQHATIPIQKVEVHERTVLIDAGIAKFTGTLDGSGLTMSGTFRQRTGELPLSFRRGAPVVRALAQAPAAISGNWLGTLNAGGQKLRLALQIENGAGAMISLDQGMAKLPIKQFDVNGQAVKIDVGIASYEGTLDSAGQQITGTFTQAGTSFPLIFQRVDKIEEPKRPQNPARPFPYAEEEVSLKGGGGVALAGTLTYPKYGSPFAAVLLLTGSGPQDRDEAIMGHKPFLVLSDYLTRLGFAVLRLDDRGMGKSGGVFSDATYSDKVADAIAGVEWLKGRKEIDPTRIGLLGHSEGGAIAPLAANQSKDVAFIVMMAGPGVPGDQLMKQQGIDITRASGGDEAAVNKQVEVQSKMFQILREEKDSAAAEKRIKEMLGAMPGAAQQAHVAVSPTIRELIAYDPGTVLRRLACPVLAMDGTLDLQVSAKQNLPAIAAALAESKSGNWQVVDLSGLNHLFQTAKTGNVPEYSTIEETISPLALRTLGDWLRRVAARP